jgi:8-oxo-dGTP pyrophosphatase MutT (NUDIX family)
MSSTPHPFEPRTANGRRGAVAVVVRDGRFLVIRRSASVVAPGAYCFPGGAIEPGESEHAALVREMQEELAVRVEPLRRIWHSVTPWKVELFWWLAALEPDQEPVPNPAEVAAVCWLTADEMRATVGLLESNVHFLDALARAEFSLDGES